VARITLEKIDKAFGRTQVLNGIDLDIADGEFLTLVGPSGCGKSTLLRIIAGLEKQNNGNVRIDDEVVNEKRPSRRDLAMVFQSYALYPHLTVRQNMAVPLQLRDMTFIERLPLFGRFAPGCKAKRTAIATAVKSVSETLQIAHLLDRKPGHLSGGQRQRVAVGRAMVRDPAAFLMDEPLSNLDAALRVHMRAELSALHRSLGTTFVYVTHDQAEALTMSDRMAVMMDGEILQLGDDKDGRLSFLGVMLSRRLRDAATSQITIGLRPEHLYLHPQTSGKTFGGKLVYKENLGSEVFLHLGVPNVEDNIIVRVNPGDAQKLNFRK